MAQLIPLDSSPQQSFTVALNVDSKTLVLQLSLRYNEMASYWVMDIDDQLGNPLLAAVPLVTGVWPAGNLLGQYGYLAIGSAYVINASGVSTDRPGANNLGTDFILIWGDTAA